MAPLIPDCSAPFLGRSVPARGLSEDGPLVMWSPVTAGPGLRGAQRPLVAGMGRGEEPLLGQRGVLWEPRHLAEASA